MAVLFFAIAVINVASGVWWLAALMAVVGVVNVRRAVSRASGAQLDPTEPLVAWAGVRECHLSLGRRRLISVGARQSSRRLRARGLRVVRSLLVLRRSR